MAIFYLHANLCHLMSFLGRVVISFREAPLCVHTKSLQSRLTLCHTMAGSLPGSSVHGLLQARTLEWVAVPSSRGSSWSRSQVLYPLSHLGSHIYIHIHIRCISLVMDREAWRVVIHGVAKSQTQLSDWTELTHIRTRICITESLCCMPESNIILWINYSLL